MNVLFLGAKLETTKHWRLQYDPLLIDTAENWWKDIWQAKTEMFLVNIYHSDTYLK
jgi:hypothetical protein